MGQNTNKLTWEALPEKKIVPVFTADTRAHRLSAQRNFDENSYTLGMGGIFPFLETGNPKFNIQLCAAGSTYLTLIRKQGGGSVVNMDFFGDFFADLNFHKNWSFRTGFGHTSQHLSDDAIVAGNPFKNYAKDYLQEMAIYQNTKYRFIGYGGLYWNYNFKTQTDISNKVLMQFGFEHTPYKMRGNGGLFYGGDIKIRQELNYAFTLNLQAGYKITKTNGRNFRLAIDYTSGTDERGYFQPANRNFAHVGLYFDF